jgi:hypothetical protein
MPIPDPNNPTPTPANPNPEPARPPPPPENPPPEPPGVPPPSPGPVPYPEEEPNQIPPASPPEVPSSPKHPGPAADSAETHVEMRAFRWLKRSVVVVVCILGTVALATAQSPNGGEELVPVDPCQAKPEDHSEDPTTDTSKKAQPSQNALEDCKGVLTPPTTGDEEIEEPPPDTGTTRIIRPDDVPEQPPN